VSSLTPTHWLHYVKTWRHTHNRKYIAYCTAVRRGPGNARSPTVNRQCKEMVSFTLKTRQICIDLKNDHWQKWGFHIHFLATPLVTVDYAGYVRYADVSVSCRVKWASSTPCRTIMYGTVAVAHRTYQADIRATSAARNICDWSRWMSVVCREKTQRRIHAPSTSPRASRVSMPDVTLSSSSSSSSMASMTYWRTVSSLYARVMKSKWGKITKHRSLRRTSTPDVETTKVLVTWKNEEKTSKQLRS